MGDNVLMLLRMDEVPRLKCVETLLGPSASERSCLLQTTKEKLNDE